MEAISAGSKIILKKWKYICLLWFLSSLPFTGPKDVLYVQSITSHGLNHFEAGWDLQKRSFLYLASHTIHCFFCRQTSSGRMKYKTVREDDLSDTPPHKPEGSSSEPQIGCLLLELCSTTTPPGLLLESLQVINISNLRTQNLPNYSYKSVLHYLEISYLLIQIHSIIKNLIIATNII